MNIQIRSSGGPHFSIPLPTALVFNPTVLSFALNQGQRYAGAAVPHIPRKDLAQLCDAIQQVKEKYGTWELVHVESHDGDLVRIVL